MANPVLIKQRGQQSNFETILQIISMRGQPEEIQDPEKSMESLNSGMWGANYKNKTKVPVWKFTFEVSQEDVFNDGESRLGNLFGDCKDVPMIKNLEEWIKVDDRLNITPELKNIYFEITE